MDIKFRHLQATKHTRKNRQKILHPLFYKASSVIGMPAWHDLARR